MPVYPGAPVPSAQVLPAYQLHANSILQVLRRGNDRAQSEIVAGRGGHAAVVHRAGEPWENGYCESFNGKLRDECLNGEIFYSLKEAQVVIEQWRKFYNTERPHSALGYRPPAPPTWMEAA